MSTEDAHIRTAIALVLVLIALFFIEQPALRIILALVAGVLATTAFLRTCPVYNFLYDKDTPQKGGTSAKVSAQAEVAQEPVEAPEAEPAPAGDAEAPEQEKK